MQLLDSLRQDCTCSFFVWFHFKNLNIFDIYHCVNLRCIYLLFLMYMCVLFPLSYIKNGILYINYLELLFFLLTKVSWRSLHMHSLRFSLFFQIILMCECTIVCNVSPTYGHLGPFQYVAITITQ